MTTYQTFSSVRALDDARSAFARLLEKGQGRSDRDLARDADYRTLHRAGVQIAVQGGEAAIENAALDLCRSTQLAGAQSELHRFWYGIGRWSEPG